MIKITAAAVLVLACAAAAQAGGGAHFTMWPSTLTQGGGAGYGVGAAGSGTMLHVPAAHFAVREASGNTSDYVPSTFVSYDSAVAEGKASVAGHAQLLGASAQEGGKPTAKNAKIQIVQKQNGAPAIQR